MFMQWLKNVSIVTASVVAFTGNANATNVTLSYGDTPLLVSVNRDAGVIGAFNFTDIYDLFIDPSLTFSLPFTFKTTELEEPAYNIVDGTLTYGLYDSSNTLLTGPYLLAAGESYQLRVSGTADGFSGGQYFLSTNVSTPVPEPDLALIMLAGLGMISLVSARKSHSA
ncbi:PEP-CTERM sorting domain-containing protein [Methylophilus sp. QUAN]|uniref:PEP-CTERM sorting domain-containing protein n=1 Tax=Methylophilus sp. QUAN TaxID=2781020 RepID=UPI00188FE574|nr:PEP-CTERM sorting domain-containing protein [Methylophilus sp. QUAN]MBF4991778.1 hypothetical protein [Methylophilus sp. QUAN]